MPIPIFTPEDKPAVKGLGVGIGVIDVAVEVEVELIRKLSVDFHQTWISQARTVPGVIGIVVFKNSLLSSRRA
jgi:hypothetical protein